MFPFNPLHPLTLVGNGRLVRYLCRGNSCGTSRHRYEPYGSCYRQGIASTRTELEVGLRPGGKLPDTKESHQVLSGTLRPDGRAPVRVGSSDRNELWVKLKLDTPDYYII